MSRLQHFLAYNRCSINIINLVNPIAVLKVSREDASWFLASFKKTITYLENYFHSKLPFEFSLSLTHVQRSFSDTSYLIYEDIIALTEKYNLILHLFYVYILKYFIYLFLERGEGREKRETSTCGFFSCVLPTGDPAHNTGKCPDQESNQ